MTEGPDDPAFERLLRDAMHARPHPGAVSNLAYRAMERARSQEIAAACERLQMLVRLRRRNRLVGIAATILVGFVVLLGAERVWDGGLLSDTSTTSIATTSDSASSTGTSGSTITLGVLLTAESLVVALILMSAGMSSPRPEFGFDADAAFC